MSVPYCSLMDAHNALSHLTVAVKQALPHDASVKIQWQSHTYLTVEVECRAKSALQIAMILSRGVLVGPYDYRFSSVIRPMWLTQDPDRWVTVSAMVNLSHDMDLQKQGKCHFDKDAHVMAYKREAEVRS